MWNCGGHCDVGVAAVSTRHRVQQPAQYIGGPWHGAIFDPYHLPGGHWRIEAESIDRLIESSRPKVRRR